MAFTLEMADELELVEFFGAASSREASEDGFLCFEVEDERGLTLRFSVDVAERSVQTVVSTRGELACRVAHELAERLVVDGAQLRCEFATAESTTVLVVEVRPRISVTWSTLQTR